jgi:hypothetical protein
MRNPDVYPELILESAQEKIRALAREQGRDEARSVAKSARRGRRGLTAWWRHLTRPHERRP